MDMKHYQDTKPWILYDQKLKVTTDNEHLEMFVMSGEEEESKNVGENISSMVFFLSITVLYIISNMFLGEMMMMNHVEHLE